MAEFLVLGLAEHWKKALFIYLVHNTHSGMVLFESAKIDLGWGEDDFHIQLRETEPDFQREAESIKRRNEGLILRRQNLAIPWIQAIMILAWTEPCQVSPAGI